MIEVRDLRQLGRWRHRRRLVDVAGARSSPSGPERHRQTTTIQLLTTLVAPTSGTIESTA
jgi:hypothetical protein